LLERSGFAPSKLTAFRVVTGDSCSPDVHWAVVGQRRPMGAPLCATTSPDTSRSRARRATAAGTRCGAMPSVAITRCSGLHT
jgi:hypothetical protein